MEQDYQSLVVLIPSRNRARLAIGAIRSVLTQRADNVQLLVSDNSTKPEEIAALSRFCRRLNDRRLNYIVPPEPLSMSSHWNWAMQQALESNATHFTILTDRMMFRPGDLERVLGIVKQYPSRLLSYKHDRVADLKDPVKLEIQDWTGDLFEIRSKRLLDLTTQAILHESLPRMLNNVVSRNTLKTIEKSFGVIFDSIAPDFNFCYKALALEDSILFFDKAPLIHRAAYRSTGQTCARGVRQGDYDDFLSKLGPQQVNFAAPIPELRTTFNAIAHEYCHVKNESNSSKFAEIDMEKYLQFNAFDVEAFEDEHFKDEMKKILLANGWIPRETITSTEFHSGPKVQMGLSDMKTKLKSALTKRVGPYVARHFGVQSPGINELEFKTSNEALAYALKFPLPPVSQLPSEQSLLEYKRIDDYSR